MFLKKLEIKGFKSFADKIELEFPNGITAVVGPNGSGKSNIADAVRWVLGEQSAKTLRGQRMEDIIFAGSDSRRAINYAEVSLILDNANRKLPIDYSEVMVSRKVYRSGESEYLINNQNCRLKDITELFMDTGLGKEAYSIIGQGKIEEILSSKSEERRGIFEEAAGIVKFKNRKKEALKRLEETEANLLRVFDLVNELEDQLDPLKEASEQAEKYIEFKEKLSRIDIALYAHQISVIDADWKLLTAEKASLEEELGALATELNAVEADFTQTKWDLTKCEEQIEQLQAKFTELATSHEKFFGDKKVLEERSRNLVKSIEDLEEERTQIKESIKEKEEIANNKASDYQKLEEVFAEKKAELEAKNHNLLNFERDLGRANKDLEEARKELLVVQEQKNSADSSIYHIEEVVRLAQDKLSEVADLILSYQVQEATLLSNLQIKKEQRRQTNEDLIDKKYRLSKAEDKYKELLSNHEKNKEAYQAKLQSLRAKEDRKSMLNDLEEDYAGYFQGTREMMLEYKRRPQVYSGVRGAVADLIEIPSGYEEAMETALANALQHIVVDDDRTAKQGIQYLKANNKGKATFLPISIVKGNKRKYESCEHLAGFIGYAYEIVTSQDLYQEILVSLLGNTIIARDMDAASQIAKASSYRARIVTMDGDYINPGGAMTGGSSSRNRASLLSRKSEINKLEEEIKNITYEITEKRKKLEAELKEIEEENDLIEKGRLDLEEAKLGLNSIETEIVQLEEEEKYYKNYLSDYKKQEKELSIQLTTEKDKISSNQDLLGKQLALEKELKDRIERLQDGLSQQNKEVDETKGHITNVKVEIAKYEEQLRTVQDMKARDANEINALTDRINKMAEQITEYQGQITEIENEIAQRQTAISSQEEEKKAISEQLDRERIKRKELQNILTEEEYKLGEKSRANKKIENQVHHLDVKINRFDVELSNALSKLQEEYEITYERAMAEYPLEIEVKVAQKEIDRLKNSIKLLGAVNLGAIEEYSRVNERYSFLSSQHKDLSDAIDKLLGVINDINQEMEKKFVETFDLIKNNFTDVFQQMFGGGRASIQLSDPKQVLTSGIEIFAEPPGKKLQHLSLLSGGERALTALALLFSILKVKPVPFCILDEVEAALDESNVSRFANYLREFCSNTQFIIVTHRKGTMEAADILYGVTMEGSGVSRMLSVKLEEAIELNKLDLEELN